MYVVINHLNPFPEVLAKKNVSVVSNRKFHSRLLKAFSKSVKVTIPYVLSDKPAFDIPSLCIAYDLREHLFQSQCQRFGGNFIIQI